MKVIHFHCPYSPTREFQPFFCVMHAKFPHLQLSMASEEFYGDGGGSDLSGSDFDDEPFETQSPLEKIKLIFLSVKEHTPTSITIPK